MIHYVLLKFAPGTDLEAAEARVHKTYDELNRKLAYYNSQLERGDEEQRIMAQRGIDAMAAFFRSIGMPTTLKELGVSPTEEEILLLARNCAKATGGKVGSAMPLYEADMAAIYRMAKE